MNNFCRRWVSIAALISCLLYPTLSFADLGELTKPVQDFCVRLITSKTLLKDNPEQFEFKLERAKRLSEEVQKDSPNVPQVISDLVALTPPTSKGVKAFKRAIDVTVGFVGLTLTLPLYPIIATAIKLDSKGPIFYKQQRSGILKNGEGDLDDVLKQSDFKMYKFRSMRVDAEKLTGAVLAAKDDPRITRIGKFLRKTRLDELPQFINVLKGDMSIVGPRPERRELILKTTLAIPYFAERMRDNKPGITGLAQVSLGYTGGKIGGKIDVEPTSTPQNPEQQMLDDFQTKLLYDLVYKTKTQRVKEFLMVELWILVKTPLVMLRGVGQ